MNKGSALKIIIGTISLCAIAACTKKIPSQVIYRFDDNRYLELIGYIVAIVVISASIFWAVNA